MNLVVGATGMLGGNIARKLISKKLPVRVMVRSGSDYRALESEGAEVILGDLKDPSSLAAATRGITTVITTANAAQRGGADTVESVDLTGNRLLIDAAARSGVKQFVFLSASGVDEASPVPLFVAKAKSEAHLRESGVPWTVVAPMAFMDVWFPMVIGSALGAGKPVPVVNGGTARRSFVAVEDVAALTAAVVGHPQATNRRIVLGGPEALSWSDVISETGKILGRDLPVQNLQPGQPVPTLPAPMNEFIGFLLAGLEQQEEIVDSTGTARTFGITLTPARTILRQLFGG